jgi:sugar transferase (PEP-CTERM/EpsH1 system associated)
MAEYIFRSKTFQLSSLQASRSLLVMDFCDVDSDKWHQYSQQVQFPLNFLYRIEHRRLLQYEKKINIAFDHSIFVSQQEAKLFSSLYPKAKNVEVIPNGVDTDYFSPDAITRAPSVLRPSPILLFIGVMNYYPNIDGVKWFCEEILPLIKKSYSEVHFYILGSNPTNEVRKLGKDKCVTVTGFVKDIRPYYQLADICVVPLRLACGVQNKVLEAMAMGKPVVTTTAAIQSIHSKPGEHLLVADTPKDFSKTVGLLLSDLVLKERLGNEARQFVKKEYNWSANMKKLGSFIGATKINSF